MFTATLDKYTGGQCISCPYTGRPTLAGNDGNTSGIYVATLTDIHDFALPESGTEIMFHLPIIR